MPKSIGEKINEDLHIISKEYARMCALMDETLHQGECIFCGETTDNEVCWSSNDPKTNGTRDWICPDCRYNEL